MAAPDRAAMPPAAQHVAVALDGALPGDAAATLPGHPERRALERRLRDAATVAITRGADLHAVLTLLWLVPALLACLAGARAPAVAAGTALAVLLPTWLTWASVPWWPRAPAWAAAPPRRRAQAVSTAAVAAAVGLLVCAALVGWQAGRALAQATAPAVAGDLPGTVGAAASTWLAPLACAAAAALAAVQWAPRRDLSRAAAAMPAVLVAGACGGIGLPAASPGGALVVVLMAALVAALVALGGAAARLAHGRWRERELAALRQEDELRAARAERDAALRADREKSRFLAIASHDLRQPVHALGLFAATLEKRLHGREEEPLMRNVMRSIDGLERSFNAMLDVSRLDAGTVEANRQHFPLRDIFRRLHMHFAGQAELSGLSLRFSPGGKSVTSDPQLLERILGNLIQNALKYTEQGGVVVVARSTATHVNVEVWDTGVGVKAEDLPRMFDEFWQVGRGERARTRGLGMGLAIVRRLAGLLGHGLSVSSRPGHGTMFRLSIRRGELAGIQDATVAADTVPMSTDQPRTVLVIDDEEPIREGLQGLLETWGCHAVVAASLDEAERLAGVMPVAPDLILSDLHLGDGPDGIEAIAAVRRLYGYPVPALLITGDTTPGEMRRATDSGHPLMFKPVQPRRLFEMLRFLSP